jgi:hypothetical protein
VRLGLLGATDFASWVSAPLLDMDAEEAGDVLDMLVEIRFVEVRIDEEGLPRFRLHDLVRIYALERLAAEEPVAERARALRRLLGCWLSLAAEAHRRSYGGDFAVLHSATEGWKLPVDTLDQLLVQPTSWLRAERAGLVSAVLQAAQVGFDELCWDLAVTSVTLFESEYQVDDWRKTHEVALEVTRQAGNLRGQAAVLWSLGNLAVRERLSDAAHYLEHALRIFERIQARAAGEVDQVPLQFRAALDDAGELLPTATAVHAGSRPSAARRRLTSLRPNGLGSSGSSSFQYSTGESPRNATQTGYSWLCSRGMVVPSVISCSQQAPRS